VTLNFMNPDTMAPPPSNFSHVVDVPDGTRMAFISGQVAIDKDGNQFDGFDAQCKQVLRNLELALEAVDMEITDLVRLNAFITDAADVGAFRDIRDNWSGGHPAASTLVVVSALAAPHWKVEIEAVAARAK
jgi:2-iminobutanoate/2-iminopropanoate deaminase